MNFLLLQGSKATDLKELSFYVHGGLQTSCGFRWKHKLSTGLPVLELIEPPVKGTPDAGNLLPSLPVQQLLSQHVAHQHINFVDDTAYFTQYFL